MYTVSFQTTTHTIYFTYIQLNFSTTTTLGTEESGHCREVETRFNVWTLHQKKMAVVERLALVEWRSNCIKNCWSGISGLKFGPIWFGTIMYLRITITTIQSNAVTTDIEGVIESVCIKQVEFREKCKGFLSPETKQTVCNNEVSTSSGCL